MTTDEPAPGADGSAPNVDGGTWAENAARLYRRTDELLAEVDDGWRGDRAVFAEDATATLVELNRLFQSLTDHLAPVADENTTAWREEIVTLSIPQEQRGVRRVAVPTGDDDTAVVPVGTSSGGRAWAKRGLSLADLDRWRDRTLTRRVDHSARTRGTEQRSEQVFLPPGTIRTGHEQVAAVLRDLEDAFGVSLDLDLDAANEKE